ncbi:hypothetical protein N803_14705 [Knoellia subterranea KCTC 19937]|uniref:DUF4386 family protein n=1 Tax=Knoellia subterranea KCTC 19937 TaxID=1385521 RepID=A0A0A0JKI0_9MICO|nr:hypothetical protein N803_14705 [Knoellia subterranea KCTC 19937]
MGLTPGQSDVEETVDIIRVAGENPTMFQVSSAIGFVAAALLVPGIWTVATTLRPRTPWLASVGGWMMATGYIMFCVLGIESLINLAVAQGGDPVSFATAIDEHTSPVMFAVYFVFGLGALGGGLILGIAMLRQRDAVPAWAGWAMIVSEPVRVIGLLTGLSVVGPPLASVLIAVGFAGVLLRRSDALA